jgi:anti-anti-sigma regulatory factor
MAQPEYHHLRCRTAQGVIVLTLTEPLLRAEAVREARAALAGHGCRKAVLDLADVRRALGDGLPHDQEPFPSLLALRRQLQREGGRLVLCNLAPELRELFRVTWLLNLFEVRPDVHDAVAALTA